MSDENIATVRKLFDGVSTGNLDLFDTLLDDAFVEHEEGLPFPPNKAGVKAFFGMVRDAFPDVKFVEVKILADGDQVSTLVTMEGTHGGEFMGMPASNKAVSVNLADFFLVKGGKVTDHWGVMDMAGLMQQLGA